MGTWTVTCPEGGVYAGKGHYVSGKNGFNLHLRRVVTIKSPRGGSCEADNPHSMPSCAKRERCVKRVSKKCGKTCDAETVCRATVSCP